jgi:predicted nuclease of predicted toxin-antitoxin system
VTNDLRILVDACVEGPTARELMSASSLKAKYVCDLPDLKDKEDADVMDFAISERRIVVTTDKGFNEKAFKICEHPGIIIINTRSKHRAAPVFREFLLSGHRKHAEESVTYVNETNIRVKKHNDKVVEFPLS